MARKRDYQAEYRRRIARGLEKGLSRQRARGHTPEQEREYGRRKRAIQRAARDTKRNKDASLSAPKDADKEKWWQYAETKRGYDRKNFEALWKKYGPDGAAARLTQQYSDTVQWRKGNTEPGITRFAGKPKHDRDVWWWYH